MFTGGTVGGLDPWPHLLIFTEAAPWSQSHAGGGFGCYRLQKELVINAWVGLDR